MQGLILVGGAEAFNQRKEKTQYLMETGQVSGRIRLIRGLRDSSVTAGVFRCIALTLGSDPGAHKSARDLHKGGMNKKQ